jgi:DNA processing protein
MVGSRAATPSGQAQARIMAQELAKSGFTVVSGLARGIDTASHRGALQGGGRTIAVLGSGLDRLYPSENQGLSDEIAASGAVVSEFPLGTPPAAANFHGATGSWPVGPAAWWWWWRPPFAAAPWSPPAWRSRKDAR